MSDFSWRKTVELVHERANFQCEYCKTSQRVIGQAMHVEHIYPDGGDGLDNLCLSCASCNLSKAQAISAIDPDSLIEVDLFHPRHQNWDEHFEWVENGTIVQGKTSQGRATILRLKMNQLRLIEARAICVLAKVHPPT
jgi:hypothetical protein